MVEASEPPALSPLDLPSHLLDSILSLALQLHRQSLARAEDGELFDLRKRDPRRVLPLVSRGFLAAADASHSLWRRVQLNLLALPADRVPPLVRWLHRHAAALRCLALHGRALPTVEAALLAQLAPLAAAVQAAGAAGLEALELPRCLGAAVLARLDPAGLVRLRAIAVDLAPSRPAAGGGGESVRERRRGRAEGQLSEAELATLCLLRLPALEELLVQSSLDGRLLAACPGAWPRLRRLAFADARDVARIPSLPSLACLPGLTSLRFYQRDGFALPGPLTALRQLSHLHAAVRYRDDPLVVEEGLSSLTSLRALWLQHAAFEAPAALAALPRLHTLALVGGAAGWAAVLEGLAAAAGQLGAQSEAAAATARQHALVAAAAAAAATDRAAAAPAAAPARGAGLRALHLQAHAQSVAEVPGEVWQALAQLPAGLTRLELPYNRLRELPEGRYLSELRALDLSHNSLAGVPPHLPGCCPHLSALSLGQQETAAPGEGDADMAALRALPALRLLVTSAGHYSGSHLSAGLRSPAEGAHLGRLRAVLPSRCRVSNRQGDWERAAGRLAALFDVSVRQGRP
ncbi:hypothetical protein ABPG75_005010 [Micractinium tetrahymenae]